MCTDEQPALNLRAILRTYPQGDPPRRRVLLNPLGKSQGVRLLRPFKLRVRASGKPRQTASRAGSTERQIARIGSVVHFAHLAELEALVARLWRDLPSFSLADETCVCVETLRVVAQFVPVLGRDGPVLVAILGVSLRIFFGAPGTGAGPDS